MPPIRDAVSLLICYLMHLPKTFTSYGPFRLLPFRAVSRLADGNRLAKRKNRLASRLSRLKLGMGLPDPDIVPKIFTLLILLFCIKIDLLILYVPVLHVDVKGKT